MNFKKIIILLLILTLSYTAFTEIGDISQAKIKQIQSIKNSQGNIIDYLTNKNLFDLVTYNENGDWALIVYDSSLNYSFINFYDINGIKKSTYTIQTDKNQQFNGEGQRGVSICQTNKNDEVFVTFTFKTKNNVHIILGGIIDDKGNKKRGNDWIKVFSDEATTESFRYGYSYPKITFNENFIYAMAYANYDKFLEFSQDIEQEPIGPPGKPGIPPPRRNLEEVQEEPYNDENVGNAAFNTINIQGQGIIQDSENLKGTILIYKDGEETQKTFIKSNYDFQILSVSENNVIAIYNDPINIIPNGTQNQGEYLYIMYVKLSKQQVSLPKFFDNTKGTYPNKIPLDQFNPSMDFKAVIGTTQFTMTYLDENQEIIAISTIDSTDDSVICHETIVLEEMFQTFFDFQSILLQNPSTVQISSTEAYLILSVEVNRYIQQLTFQYNPSTCTIDSTQTPFYSAKKYNYIYLTQPLLLKNQNLNKMSIANLVVQATPYANLLGYLIEFKTMFNCETTNEVKNTCETCQEGYFLNVDGQCLQPHCGLNCSNFNQHCNFQTNFCVECNISSDCEGNSNGSICFNNQCQQKCFEYQDCASINKICDQETNECVNNISLSNALPVKVKNSDKVQIVEANNPNSGQLELDFEILDEEQQQYFLEFVKLEREGQVAYPLEVSDKMQGKISVMLPRNTKNGINQFKIYANQIIPNSSNNQRRILNQNINLITMSKTVKIVDSMEKYDQEQQLLSEYQETQIKQKEALYDDENSDKKTLLFILLPIMLIGYIFFLIAGYMAGKKVKQNESQGLEQVKYQDTKHIQNADLQSPQYTEKA